MKNHETVEEWSKGEIERGHVEVQILDCPRRSITNKLCAGLADRPELEVCKQFNVLCTNQLATQLTRCVFYLDLPTVSFLVSQMLDLLDYSLQSSRYIVTIHQSWPRWFCTELGQSIYSCMSPDLVPWQISSSVLMRGRILYVIIVCYVSPTIIKIQIYVDHATLHTRLFNIHHFLLYCLLALVLIFFMIIVSYGNCAFDQQIKNLIVQQQYVVDLHVHVII